MTDTETRAKKIIVVGGVAGGASFATRARRLDEQANIIVLERGPYVSFANCGLPYHIGGAIPDREALKVQTPESLKARFNLDVRIKHEVVKIDPKAKTAFVKNLNTGDVFTLEYDKLALSPGAEPFRPPIPGIDRDNLFTLRTIPDLDAIMAWVREKKPNHATVVGGGFIGLEVAENLKESGLSVTIVEMMDQVMPPVDPDIAEMIHQNVTLHGIELRLKTKVVEFKDENDKTCVCVEGMDGGGDDDIYTDMVVMSIGVRPEVYLAKEAGLEIGSRGGILVDDRMQTSDPDIFAVGDAVETRMPVLDIQTLIPLAGPANRQGRIAADNALGRDSRYRGTLGTSICKVFELAVAATGASEKLLKKMGVSYRKAIIHAASHAGYYPNAYPVTLKLMFSPDDGKVLGAQAVGAEGIDKRIDVLATAIAAGMTVEDLVNLELAYAPPFSSARDPVNQAGMVASNILNGDLKPIYSEDIPDTNDGARFLLDVRTPLEFEAGTIPGAVNIDLAELRNRIDELPRDKKIIVFCQVGLRGHVACRQLLQKGFDCVNLVGGYKSWSLEYRKTEPLPPIPYTRESFCGSPETSPEKPRVKKNAAPASSGDGNVNSELEITVDCSGLQCPGPLMRINKEIDALVPGQRMRVVATDPGFPSDAASWAERSGHTCIQAGPSGDGKYVAVIEKGLPVQSVLREHAAATPQPQQLTMVVFSNDLDKAYAAFIIANGAQAMGMKVNMFFTFWGLNILRKSQPPAVKKNLISKMFGFMMPRGAKKLALSKMHMAGMGTMMMKRVMKQKHVKPLPDLIDSARENGVSLVACSMTMDVMGIAIAELIDGVKDGGVATFLKDAEQSGITLFI